MRNIILYNDFCNQFSAQFTVKYVCESLEWCYADDPAIIIQKDLKDKCFDITGVKDSKNDILGYVYSSDLIEGFVKDYLRKIDEVDISPITTPINQIFRGLKIKPFIFIKDELDYGIITRADLDKTIIRLYLFGIISIFELNINRWIDNYYKNDSWLEKIPRKKSGKCIKIHNQRIDRNENLGKIECLDISDKLNLIKTTDSFIIKFGNSEHNIDSIFNDILDVRNYTCHNYNSIVSNIDTDLIIKVLDSLEQLIKLLESYNNEN